MKAILQKINDQIENCSKSDLVIKNWAYRPLSESTTSSMWRYFPFTEKYYFELNPSFVFDYKSIHDMSEYPFIQLRDGFLGLCYFFLNNPKPIKKFSTIILIPKKFEVLVPSFWKDHVLLYDFSVNSKSPNSNKGKAYIYGQISPESFIKDSYEDRFKSLKQKINSSEYHFLTPFRNVTYLNTFDNSMFTRNATKIINKEFGDKVTFQDKFISNDFTGVTNADSFVSIDSSNFYLYDDFLFHFFTARGAAPVEEYRGDSDKALTSISLSMFHKINLYEPQNSSNFILDKKIETKLRNIPLDLSSSVFYNYCLELFKEYSESYSSK